MQKRFNILFIGILCMLLLGCSNNPKLDNQREIISEEIIESLSLTKRIVIEEFNKKEIIKNITDEKEIKKLVGAISHAGKKLEGEAVFSQEFRWKLSMYDINNQLISSIYVWNDGWIGFQDDKEYLLAEDKDLFMEVIEG